MYQEIINQVNANSRLGVAVKNLDSGAWVLPFSQLEDIKARGYNSVIDCLNNLIVNNPNANLSVYLKRKSGSSSVFVKNMSITIAPKNKAVASQEKEIAGSVESVPAAFSYTKPTAPTGMLGGVDVGVLDMYSKSQQFNQLQPQLIAKTETIETLRADKQQAKIEKMQLEYEIASLKKELETKKRPIVSEQSVGMVSGLVEMVAPMLKGAFESSGMKGANPQPQEIFSEEKTNLLTYIKNPKLSDSNANYVMGILTRLETDSEFEKAVYEAFATTPQPTMQQQ